MSGNSFTRRLLLSSLLLWSPRPLAAETSTVRPADPSATTGAIQLRNDLQQLHQSREWTFLIGQNIGHSNRKIDQGHQQFVRRLADSTGRWPAILSADYGWDEIGPGLAETNQLLIDHWKRGGLVMVSMHPPSPWGDGKLEKPQSSQDWDAMFQVDSEPAKRWQATLDHVAESLAELQRAEVVVLWRPFHEMNGNWFWWGAASESSDIEVARFQAFWQRTFVYLTAKKGLHNLLWVYAPSTRYDHSIAPVDAFYPGDRWVDVVGLDFYGDPSAASLRDGVRKLQQLDKPCGLTEFGFGQHVTAAQDNLRLIDALEQHALRPDFVVYWHSWPTSRVAIVDHKKASLLMEHPHVMTREVARVRMHKLATP